MYANFVVHSGVNNSTYPGTTNDHRLSNGLRALLINFFESFLPKPFPLPTNTHSKSVKSLNKYLGLVSIFLGASVFQRRRHWRWCSDFTAKVRDPINIELFQGRKILASSTRSRSTNPRFINPPPLFYGCRSQSTPIQPRPS